MFYRTVRLLIPFLIASLFLPIVCCNNESYTRTRLDLADSLMENAPDSALCILDGISKTDIKGKEEKARYALLKSMALDKNYVDVSDDSLIGIAHDYYDSSDDKFRRMLSKYYYARVLYYAQKYDESIIYALEALDLNNETDYLWDARINELIADIYHHSFLFNLEIERTKKAILSYRKSNRPRNVAFARCDLAIVLYANSEYYTKSVMEDSIRAKAIAGNYPALALMDSVRTEAIAIKDSLLLSYALSGLVKINNAIRRFTDALDCFWQMETCSSFRTISGQDYFEGGIAALNLGDISLAMNFLSKARDAERCEDDVYNNILLEKEICQSMGRLDLAVALADTLIAFQNRSNLEILNQPVMVAQQRYQADRIKEGEKATRNWKITLFIVVSLLSFAAMIVFVVLRLRMLRLRKTLDSTVSDVYALSEELHAKEKRISEDRIRLEELCSLSDELRENKEIMLNALSDRQRLESMMAGLWRRQFSTVDAVCRQYYTEKESTVDHKILYDKVSAELEKIRDDKSLDEIVDIVNICKDDIIGRINAQYPELTASERHFLGLLYAGFSVKSIAVILRMKAKGVYTKKTRLFEKITRNTTIDPISALD